MDVVLVVAKVVSTSLKIGRCMVFYKDESMLGRC